MKFKNLKCVEITRSEYDDIQFIQSIASCCKDAEDKIMEYLIRDKKVSQALPDNIIRTVAYNLYMAVDNNYKYMKIMD